jgi:2-(1,2-epoxy-1,2-dihydrophenyl)acetyl-CoA isomerase
VPDVLIERRGAVLVVRLNRPESKNAIGGTMFRDLAAAFELAASDDAIRAVVTIGEGSTYCVGADLGHLAQAKGSEPHQLLTGDLVLPDGTIAGGETGQAPLSPDQRRTDWMGAGSRWAERMWSLEKPTIAAINGAAGGGGLAIALLHDFRLASAGVTLATSFLRLGVGPELGMTYLLPRVVGWRAANDLLLRSRRLSAEEAEQIGLVDRVVPAGSLLSEALALAEELADLPSIAMQLTKRELRLSMSGTFHEQLEVEYRTQLQLFSLAEHGVALDEQRAQIGSRQRG